MIFYGKKSLLSDWLKYLFCDLKGEQETEEWNVFNVVAREFDDVEFAHVTDAELKKS